MNDIGIFNKWWDKKSEDVLAQRRILNAGYYFIAQQAFIAGLNLRKDYPEVNTESIQAQPIDSLVFCKECGTVLSFVSDK
jgi:hypothetical protein